MENHFVVVALSGEHMLVTPQSVNHSRFGMYAEVCTQGLVCPSLFSVVDMGYPMDDAEWQTQAEIETTSWGQTLETSQSFLFESMPFGPVSIGTYPNGEKYQYRITAPLTHEHVGMLLGIDSSSRRVWEGQLSIALSVLASQRAFRHWNPYLKDLQLPSVAEVAGHWPDCWTDEAANTFVAKKLQIVIRD